MSDTNRIELNTILVDLLQNNLCAFWKEPIIAKPSDENGTNVLFILHDFGLIGEALQHQCNYQHSYQSFFKLLNSNGWTQGRDVVEVKHVRDRTPFPFTSVAVEVGQKFKLKYKAWTHPVHTPRTVELLYPGRRRGGEEALRRYLGPNVDLSPYLRRQSKAIRAKKMDGGQTKKRKVTATLLSDEDLDDLDDIPVLLPGKRERRPSLRKKAADDSASLEGGSDTADDSMFESSGSEFEAHLAEEDLEDDDDDDDDEEHGLRGQKKSVTTTAATSTRRQKHDAESLERPTKKRHLTPVTAAPLAKTKVAPPAPLITSDPQQLLPLLPEALRASFQACLDAAFQRGRMLASEPADVNDDKTVSESEPHPQAPTAPLHLAPTAPLHLAPTAPLHLAPTAPLHLAPTAPLHPAVDDNVTLQTKLAHFGLMKAQERNLALQELEAASVFEQASALEHLLPATRMKIYRALTLDVQRKLFSIFNPTVQDEIRAANLLAEDDSQ